MIARFDLTAVDELKEVLPRFTHKPLPHLSYLKPDQIEGYWLDDIAQELTNECSTAFASYAEDRITGLVLYSDSPWDTKVIGTSVGIIKYLVGTAHTHDSPVLDDLLAEVLQHAATHGIHCVTCKVQPLQIPAIHALERHGFLLMDTLLDFLFDFSRTPLESVGLPKLGTGLRIRLAQPDDLSEVLALNQKAFAKHFGRYHSDPKLPPGIGSRVYDQWVRSAFEGWADGTFIAEVNGRLAGYAAWKKASVLEVKHSFDIAHCNLAAIHPDFSGQRVFTALILEGMRMAESFSKHLDGPAHINNYPVHRAWLKLGWKITGARHSFHKWLCT